ncbi:MAG TPA: hypothetical protein VHX17_04745 [Candidatus Cybelea sp.]|nr:hypothetical protein [Candidatus Cybelea sp.]
MERDFASVGLGAIFRSNEIDTLSLVALAAALTAAAARLMQGSRLSRKSQRVRQLLAVLGHALTMTSDGATIRVACRLYDRKTKRLLPYETWSMHRHADIYDPISVQGSESEKFVVVKAFRANWIDKNDVAIDGNYPSNVRVWHELKSVLAAPIRSLESADRETEPIGTLSCDSNKSLLESRFHDQAAEDMASVSAAYIYEILTGVSA